MIAYIDTSVLLRLVLRAPAQLAEWNELEFGFSSVLLRVEAFRALDQLWHRNELDETDLAEKRAVLVTLLARLELHGFDEDILTIASQPLPTPVRTLDAIHLATAISRRRTAERPLVFATHDEQLARAARAHHFEVIGVAS